MEYTESRSPCPSSFDPAQVGIVQAEVDVVVPTGEILVAGYSLTDNGDLDAWPDTNETVQLQVVVSNETGVNLTGVADKARDAFVSDAKIEGSQASTQRRVHPRG